ncbi:MAG: hypothetical protein L0G36_03995, partial [Brevibacterium sp.]|nr:hypothetical protein [Brevibacterium sp.]
MTAKITLSTGTHTGEAESWVAAALDVGRQTGAVDSACPVELQVLAATTLLTAFDEWALLR